MRNWLSLLSCVVVLARPEAAFAQGARANSALSARMTKFDETVEQIQSLIPISQGEFAHPEPYAGLTGAMFKLRNEMTDSLGHKRRIVRGDFAAEARRLKAIYEVFKVGAPGVSRSAADRLIADMDSVDAEYAKTIDLAIADAKHSISGVNKSNDADIATLRAAPSTGPEGERRRESIAKDALAKIRLALTRYYADTDGDNPAKLADLVPRYLPSIPAIHLPGFAETNSVTLIARDTYGSDMRDAVKETGGWLYVSDKKSKRWGEVYIDSAKKSRTGSRKPWYKY